MSILDSLLKDTFSEIEIINVISPVWSGCGEIVRCRLDGEVRVVKLISVPDKIDHPRITQSEFAVNRKRNSYLVEFNWYQQYSNALPEQAKSIECIKAIRSGQQFALVFKDFVALGYENAKPSHKHHIINWLAHFHAYHMQNNAEQLWQQGSYWHLSTRPDELKNITAPKLLRLAPKLDKQLRSCQYQTIIHGDAKLANFAFNSEYNRVIGYDFQYVGKGVGVVDLMYFLGSVCSNNELLADAEDDLNRYFLAFRQALHCYHPHINSQPIETQWRALWPVVWADFYRFLAGWKPNHIKINQYMLDQYQTVLKD